MKDIRELSLCMLIWAYSQMAAALSHKKRAHNETYPAKNTLFLGFQPSHCKKYISVVWIPKSAVNFFMSASAN
jgi:hypothetical protein